MKFKRVDDKSIRCLISKEEMFDMGIDIDDLIEDHDKAEEFLRDIVEQAKDKVGFEAVGNAFNVQLSIMPEGDLALMITEDNNAKLRNMISQFKEKMKEIQDSVSEITKEQQTKESQEEEPQEEEITEDTVKKYIEIPIYAKMFGLENTIRLAKKLEHLGNISSALYKYRDVYYLRLSLKNLKESISEAVLVMSEYSDEIIPQGQGTDVIEEHGINMIKKEAIQFLNQI